MSAARKLPVYVDADTCSECGGSCCKSFPGAAMPRDFGAPDVAVMRYRIASALASRRWSVDWWEDTSPQPFIRPATVAGFGKLRDPSWGGTCTFHGPNGCTIFPSRPSGCRGLKPDVKGGEGRKIYTCLPKHSTKEQAKRAWKPYAAMLWELSK